jgi:hypothetical protein
MNNNSKELLLDIMDKGTNSDLEFRTEREK